MKTRYALAMIILWGILPSSCEDLLNTDNQSMVDRIEGTWRCEETSSIFKSTLDYYSVYISPSASDSTQILIGNFYDLGNDVEATARVNGNSISLPQQTLMGGYTVRGSGTISSNAKQISWVYYVDDGSGQQDEVEAIYTFQF